MKNFIDKRYYPKKDDLIAEFYIEPYRSSVEEASSQVAGESSIGTWTEVVTMNKQIARDLSPTIYSIKNNIVKIAYPVELFEPGNVPQILRGRERCLFANSSLMPCGCARTGLWWGSVAALKRLTCCRR